MAADQLPQIVYPLFEKNYSGMVHGTVSRHGGLSVHPYHSNNISFGVGDDKSNVHENRKLIKKMFGVRCLASARQVHGDTIFAVRESTGVDIRAEACDALITDQRGVGLLIGHADCQAVMLYDPVKKVIGAVHSGWRGSVLNIAGKTVAALEREFGSKSSDVLAAIGPSLGPCCGEFVNYRVELPEEFHPFEVEENHFDFWKITRSQLQQSGVAAENITAMEICTACSADFFSYRRACRNGDGITGRNGSLIAML